MSDLIKREDAITAIAVAVLDDKDELEAIKAIPSVQPTGDLISRDALMKQLDERYCKPCQSREEDYNGLRCRACWVDDAVGEIEDAPSAEGGDADMTVIPEGTGLMKPCPDNGADLISRADAVSLVIKAIHETDNEDIKNYLFSGLRRQMWSLPSADAVDVNEVTIHYKPYPSAEAESDDLIIKGAKGIKDGLYNIKDGKLFQYKAKGGTVRTYQIIKGGDEE